MMDLPVDPGRYALFLGVMAVMAITPGPANLFAIATGLSHGPRAALLSVVGMNLATLVWFAAAALGLGALVAAAPGVFRWIAVAGALYVAWLGLQRVVAAWRGAGKPLVAAEGARKIGQSALASGFAVQIANPKAVLFFTAVLPPFMDPARAAGPQLAAFAVATIGMDLITMSAYGLSGGALAQRMERPRFRRAFETAVGLLLLGAAALILQRA